MIEVKLACNLFKEVTLCLITLTHSLKYFVLSKMSSSTAISVTISEIAVVLNRLGSVKLLTFQLTLGSQQLGKLPTAVTTALGTAAGAYARLQGDF